MGQQVVVLAGRGLAVAQRSLGEPITPSTGIYLADTLGEMGVFYRAAPVAFVGATLAPIGGHNPIEPVRLDAAVVHGPHTQNAAEIYAALDAGGGAVCVADAAGLAAAVGALLDEPATLKRRREAATATLVPFIGALERTLAALAPWLQPKDAAARRA